MTDFVDLGSRMEPVRWQPPALPPRGRQRVSVPPLPPIRRIELPSAGPEDVVLGADGFVYAGTENGDILRVDLTAGTVEQVVSTGGRPLGLHAEPDGSLLICDAYRGLLRWPGPGGALEVLVDSVDGVPLNFASNVVADLDGTIYFTTSSRRWPLSRYLGDVIEHSGTGRLLRRTPDGTVDTLIDGLQFANGVAFTPDRQSLIFAETAAYRLSRYHLHGPRAGTHEILVDNLPAFPDNIALGSDGLIWVTLVAPRDSLLDLLLPLPGALRKLLWRIPDSWKPAPKRTAWVLGVDPDGTIVHDLQRDGAEYATVTGVVEHDGTLILGSLHETAVAVTHVPS